MSEPTPSLRELTLKLLKQDENLHIHEIELEMQNEELRETQEYLLKILDAKKEELETKVNEVRVKYQRRLKQVREGAK